MKALSIRWRIQLWFAGLCALLLLVFAAIVTLQTADAAQRALDERLALRADALLGVCEVEDGRLVCELAPPRGGRRAELGGASVRRAGVARA